MLKKIALYFLCLLMFAGAAGHIFNPTLSDGFIPAFLPKQAVHVLAAIVEFALGVGLLLPTTRKMAAWGMIGLLSFFLILHIQDVFRTQPAIGSTMAAVIRIPFQLLFMYMAWWQTKA